MKQFFLCCILLCAVTINYAQPGALDPTYGNNGIAKADIGTKFTYYSAATQVLTGPDGRTYIILSTSTAATIVSRRFTDGSIDSSYGYNGYSRTTFFLSVVAAFQPDGKMVLAGSGGSNPYGVVRLNTNGKVDLTFGNKGTQLIDFNPTAIAVQKNGMLVVAGFKQPGEGFAVARYNTDGSADNSFNGGITSVTSFDYDTFDPGQPPTKSSGNAFAVAIQPDGKIILAGDALTDDYTGSKFALARYNADGTPDNSFGEFGKQITSFDFEGQPLDAKGYSLALQTDLKIVLGGYVRKADYTGYDFALARYNPDGTSDETFGEFGKLTTPVGCDLQVYNSIKIQTDGKIIVGGYTPGDSGNDFLLARYTAEGVPDLTFNGSGIATIDIQGSDDYAGSVTILGNGKIVIAGFSYVNGISLFSLAKFTPDGLPDPAFDADGKYLDKSCHCNTQFFASVVQSDGKLIAAGKSWNGNTYDFSIARFKTNGTLDSSFSADARQMFDFGGDDEIRSVVVQPDGKIIVAGNIGQSIGILRYNTDGSRDFSFGGGTGKIITAFGTTDIAGNILLQADGKIVLSGYTVIEYYTGEKVFVTARYNSNGTPDNTFGDNGKQFAGFGSMNQGTGRAAALQKDGKIVIAGQAYIDGQVQFALTRLNTDGTPDNSFSGDGKQTTAFGTEDFFAESIVIQPDGKIVVGGFNQQIGGAHSSFIVARYNADGEIDDAFGNNGFVVTDMGTSNFNFGLSVAILANGKIAIGGTNDNFAIAVYNINGTPDYFYNGTGSSSTEIGLSGSSIHSILFSGGYLYATGWGVFPQYTGVVARYLLTEFGPLPVSLLDFKGKLQNKKVLLQWKTENELDLAGFEVQRSATGNGGFKTVDYVIAKAGSNQQLDYSLTDENPLNGVNLYRLRLVDRNGRFSYSKTITVNNQGKTFTLNISPNPVTTSTLFVKAGGETGTAAVSIFDVAGRKMMEKRVVLNAESASPVSVDALPNGVYSLQVITASKKETVRFIKQ